MKLSLNNEAESVGISVSRCSSAARISVSQQGFRGDEGMAVTRVMWLVGGVKVKKRTSEWRMKAGGVKGGGGWFFDGSWCGHQSALELFYQLLTARETSGSAATVPSESERRLRACIWKRVYAFEKASRLTLPSACHRTRTSVSLFHGAVMLVSESESNCEADTRPNCRPVFLCVHAYLHTMAPSQLSRVLDIRVGVPLSGGSLFPLSLCVFHLLLLHGPALQHMAPDKYHETGLQPVELSMPTLTLPGYSLL